MPFIDAGVDPKATYLRRKCNNDKKPHFTEGWVEFKDKKVARTVAMMLNAQPIGGKKSTRWRDDVWTMTYLPKFKWNMLTEQIGETPRCTVYRYPGYYSTIAHEAAARTARLRVEISQSRAEQNAYLKNVELARVVDKRNEKRKAKGLEPLQPKVKNEFKRQRDDGAGEESRKKRTRVDGGDDAQLENVLGSIF